MSKTYTFATRARFVFEQRTETYKKYVEGAAAEEKRAIERKALQRRQLCCLAGRAGV